MDNLPKIDCLICLDDAVLAQLYAKAIRASNLSLEMAVPQSLLQAVEGLKPRVLLLGYYPGLDKNIPKIRKISVPTAIIYIAESQTDKINKLSLEGFLERNQTTINDVVGAVRSLAQPNYV